MTTFQVQESAVSRYKPMSLEGFISWRHGFSWGWPHGVSCGRGGGPSAAFNGRRLYVLSPAARSRLLQAYEPWRDLVVRALQLKFADNDDWNARAPADAFDFLPAEVVALGESLRAGVDAAEAEIKQKLQALDADLQAIAVKYGVAPPRFSYCDECDSYTLSEIGWMG